MTARDLLAIPFPSPRRRVTVYQALPLIVFLATFGGACLYLALSEKIVFSQPSGFLLLAAAPWVWWIHLAGLSGLTRGRAVLALLLRLGLVAVFAMLLAEPRAVRKSDVLSVVYALDVSDSIGEEAAGAAQKYVVETVSGKPEKDQAGLVVFGREAAVELPPRITFPFEVINSRVARDGTSVEKGLSLAAAMLPEQNVGRIVLISDGTQTEGNLARVLDELKARDVAVDVLPIEYTYADEVWLEKLELPRQVKIGETYEATVILSSLRAGSGQLSLSENGKVICREQVDYQAGKSRYVLPLYMRQPGYYEYVATIDPAPGKDGWKENNVAINYIYLKGEGKVLLVTDPAGDDRDWKLLADALVKADRVVETCSAYEFPNDPMSLLPYDCVIYVNVPADALDALQMRALRDAVYNQGLGFLMVGGKNSFGPGGYHRTAVEEALPVTMDISQKKILPKGALVIILHTCEIPEGNTWGKRIAKEAMRVLGAQDEVGVLAYSLGAQWIFPLTPAAQYERLVTLVNQAEIGDMPDFAATMEMGLAALMVSDAATKHMIVISDGDPSPPTPALVKKFIDETISVSTVLINPHDNMNNMVMQNIAAATGGRFYFPPNPQQLPSIFIKEAKTLRRSMIQNVIFTPEVDFPSVILKGIDALPELKGLVLSTPKPRSNTILKRANQDDIDPVLSTWRFGVGKTAAFTSDLSPNWGAAWVAWDKYNAFVKQLVTDISRSEEANNLYVDAFAEGASGLIVVEDHFREESFLEVTAEVTGQERRLTGVALKQVAPRRYQAEFPLWGRGRYQVTVSGVGPGRNERAFGGFVVPYSPEYLRFRSNPIALTQIAERTGGRMLNGQEKGSDIFVKDRRSRASSSPVIDWFLIALACLVPLDVGVRRVQLDWSVIRGWLIFRSREKVTDKTLGALLDRKRELRREGATAARTGPGLGGAIRFVPRSDQAVDGLPPTVERPAAPPTAKPEDKLDGLSTTERLVAMKKKWNKP